MKYTDENHTVIQDGNKSIPCVKGNRDYDEIVNKGLLDSVEPYVEPEVVIEPTDKDVYLSLLNMTEADFEAERERLKQEMNK